MTTIYIYALIAVLVIGIVALAVPPYVRKRRDRARSDKAMSYLRRDANGRYYVIDPKTGTMHDLAKYVAKRATADAEKTTR